MHLTIADVVLVSLGLAGLVFHCGAMFFPALVETLPGTGVAINGINALGATSMIAYVVPAVLILLGLRRQHPIALAVVALGMILVGVTMYDGGSLQIHLTAIFVSVVLLAGNAALLITPPGRRRAGPSATPGSGSSQSWPWTGRRGR